MSIEDIKKSGIVERYAMGLCSTEEENVMISHITEYPELKGEIDKIGLSLGNYAKLHNIGPSPALKSRILSEISAVASTAGETVVSSKKSSNVLSWLLGSLLIASLLGGAYLWSQNSKNQELYALCESQCDSLLQEQRAELNQWNLIKNSSNQLYAFSATPLYEKSSVQFISNPDAKENYILASSLPQLSANEAFQLWALKDGIDPIPMNVFTKGDNFIIPCDYENGEVTYAVTIERAEGASSPNLEKLIGTFSKA